jgi:type VI secretion system protein VasG
MNKTEMPGISASVIDALDRGWHFATLMFGETQIRTGHILVACLKDERLISSIKSVSKEFSRIDVETLTNDHAKIWGGSEEDNLRPMDGAGAVAAGTPGAAAGASGAKGNTALDRFSIDLTAKARSGEMDPIVGRDEEIRQIIDVLMRRRQNNPILTGEAGVGKTAVVEGFAQRIAAGEVPPLLQGNRLCALDIGLMQAGASMKGEFEQRLRSVIDEVQTSPTPIILFIDEAHTLIGAGGAAGTGDAANLLKPALARGTLKTIAATTWAEYRQHIEKDPALTRRFQPIQIGEPEVERCCNMLRGLLGPMEKHHKVVISDKAVVAAVKLSHRYIPSRQLPDKAVSLLDTACARVAISQSATPAVVEDMRMLIEAREKELASLERERDIGAADEERIGEVIAEIATAKAHLLALEGEWLSELAKVKEISAARESIAKGGAGAKLAQEKLDALVADVEAENAEKRSVAQAAERQSVSADDIVQSLTAEKANAIKDQISALEAEYSALQAKQDLTPAEKIRRLRLEAEIAEVSMQLADIDRVLELKALREIVAKGGDEAKAVRAALKAKVDELEAIDPAKRMIYPFVDEQSVASVVSDWTGIPVGRMVKDEVKTILNLAETLNKRVVGQGHGLAMIAKRIETNRAKLDNPNKPIGVFMLAGPSGVGKTESALALAEALYGGEQNMITINMSEFQEAHTVSTLKGAPPGYVGYGEGGRLTEAVRRKPYSVLLLDEVEKAHPDVHEIFFQVFDKGQMEDGTGRMIDFKNTLIILTTNVGTDHIMEASAKGGERPDAEILSAELKPHLLQVFPPALLGRIVTIPYYPLSGEMLGGIVRLQLDRIGRRVRDNHKAVFVYDDAVVKKIVSMCNDPDSGGRMVDNIVTNTLLPALSRQILNKAINREEFTETRVGVDEGEFVYSVV